MRTLDGEFVIQGVGVRAREALGDAECNRVGILEDHTVILPETRGFHDQGATLPMTTGVPQPLVEIRAQVRPAINMEDAGAVDHLGRDDHDPGGSGKFGNRCCKWSVYMQRMTQGSFVWEAL